MKNFFGVEDDLFLDANRVKILNGIAGSAKSSNVDKILTAHGISYGRYTSTNKLKRDAENRYGGHNDTIAGGLFKTVDGVFFSESKDPEFSTVVIDEILQTDSRVLKWIEHNRGKVNIIVCTDTHQMLAPEYGEAFLRKFSEFCANDWVTVIDLPKTYRARTEETAAYYYETYKAVETGRNLFRRDRKKFRTIPFAAMPYNHNDIYICHTNAAENFLFEAHRIADDYAAPLIPKGTIARKNPKTPEKYPILSQENAKGKQVGYYQPEHIGTPTRYQGSEVTESQTLYYLVESFSKVEPREWYTVVSRLYNIDNLVIVLCDIPKPMTLETYNGKPIKKTRYKTVDGDTELSDGRKLSEVCKDKGTTINLPYKEVAKIMENIEDTADTHFHRDRFICNGKRIVIEQPEGTKKSQKAVSMTSLLAKEPDFDFRYMAEFMAQFEKTQKKEFGQMIADTLRPPCLRMNEAGRKKESYSYGIDLKASYPTILAKCKLPLGGRFYPAPDDYEGGLVDSDGVDWYAGIVEGMAGLTVVTGTMAKLYEKEGWRTFRYLGTSKAKQGSRMGATLYEMAFGSIESNEKRKGVHYGLMFRPWIKGIEQDEEKNTSAYTINERNNHQLLMLAILNEQAAAMLKIKKEIYGETLGRHGRTIADGMYFDYNGDIQELGKRIEKAVPGFSFRIFKNSEEDKRANILFQNYEELRSAKDIKREKDRERIKEKRKKEKEAQD